MPRKIRKLLSKLTAIRGLIIVYSITAFQYCVVSLHLHWWELTILCGLTWILLFPTLRRLWRIDAQIEEAVKTIRDLERKIRDLERKL